MKTKPEPNEECCHKGQNSKGQPKNNEKNKANSMQRHNRETIVCSIVCKEFMFCLTIVL